MNADGHSTDRDLLPPQRPLRSFGVADIVLAVALASGCTAKDLSEKESAQIEESIAYLELHEPVLSELFGASEKLLDEQLHRYDTEDARAQFLYDSVKALRADYERGSIVALQPSAQGRYPEAMLAQQAHAEVRRKDENERIVLSYMYDWNARTLIVDENGEPKLHVGPDVLLHEEMHNLGEYHHLDEINDLVKKGDKGELVLGSFNGIGDIHLIGASFGDTVYSAGLVMSWYEYAGRVRSLENVGGDSLTGDVLYAVDAYNASLDDNAQPIDKMNNEQLRPFVLEQLREDIVTYSTAYLMDDVRAGLKDMTFTNQGVLTEYIDPSSLTPDQYGRYPIRELLGISAERIDEVVDANYEVFEQEQRERWERRADSYQQEFGIDARKQLRDWRREARESEPDTETGAQTHLPDRIQGRR